MSDGEEVLGTGTNPLDPTHWTKTVGPVFAAGNGVAAVDDAPPTALAR